MTASTTHTPAAADSQQSGRQEKATRPRAGQSPRAKIGRAATVETALRGYRRVSTPERAGFGMLTSFSVTVGVSRAINYIRERRRDMPRLRSWVRHAYHAPGREQLRVHHFLPGIALAFLSGAAAIFKREDGYEFWFSLPFGAGAGLTLDEIAVLTELDNPYWGSERLAAAQAAVAAFAALAFATHFHRCGARVADHYREKPEN